MHVSVHGNRWKELQRCPADQGSSGFVVDTSIYHHYKYDSNPITSYKMYQPSGHIITESLYFSSSTEIEITITRINVEMVTHNILCGCISHNEKRFILKFTFARSIADIVNLSGPKELILCMKYTSHVISHQCFTNPAVLLTICL